MDIVLAQPRGFCAGVDRAIEIVETALEKYASPVYVLHEIVHNLRVVEDLKSRGAVFVERLDEVPVGAVTIFSAHGVATASVKQAQDRNLQIIDATCPLVTKVHKEVSRHARSARGVILIGHEGHPEVVGTFGQYDTQWGGAIYLVQTVADVEQLVLTENDNSNELAYVTQTTLSVDDTQQIIAALKKRFPAIIGPRKDDICYATQNRQNAVRQLKGKVDVLLVVGARNSSNSNRLQEMGAQMGIDAYLVQDANDINPDWFQPHSRIGLTAGASAPEVLVDEVLTMLKELGETSIIEIEAEPEKVTFRLPLILAKPRYDATPL